MNTSAQQIEANRRNAQLSTGPRTTAGKAASAANSTKSGLFATHLSVRPNEAAEYEEMRDRLLLQLRPHRALEESLALQIVNANWRLRRCDLAESAIPVLHNEANPGEEIHDFNNPAQRAIERARTSAENTIRRTTKDLKELQAERWRRATLKLTGPIDPEELGLAPIKEAMADIPGESERNRLMIRSHMMQYEPIAPKEPGRQNEANSLGKPVLQNEANSPPAAPVAPRRAPVGRNETCPCASGQKYKRCCGHWSRAA